MKISKDYRFYPNLDLYAVTNAPIHGLPFDFGFGDDTWFFIYGENRGSTSVHAFVEDVDGELVDIVISEQDGLSDDHPLVEMINSRGSLFKVASWVRSELAEKIENRWNEDLNRVVDGRKAMKVAEAA